MLSMAIIFLGAGILFLLITIWYALSTEDHDFVILLFSIAFCLSATMGFLINQIKTDENIKNQCEDNSISYELIESIADVTGESKHDVFYFCKYAAGADMDLVDAIMIIDPDLSEEEAAAIVTTSDLKQSKEE